ncbi:MAG: DUF3883 domain-containing protein [Coriobacteriia bacterium]|nr:DUF3883 domain-containing protein [Coriobacteriia bacterium]
MKLVSRDWSQVEVEAVVADYFAMLQKELRGEAFNKSVHRRALLTMLDQRTDGSVERKHSNISAVLVELDHPYLRGYKPLYNYQRALVDAVVERLSADGELEASVQASTTAVAQVPSVSDILARLVDAPMPSTPAAPVVREHAVAWRVRRGTNYLEREARNSSLGLAGEEFVVNFERARLLRAGADRFVDRVEHVSLTVGDGLGYDVRSFDSGGSELLIEVKTTGYGKLTPFFLSPNELNVSRQKSSNYQLYRVFDFRTDPRLFAVSGALDVACNLEPSQYLARVG